MEPPTKEDIISKFENYVDDSIGRNPINSFNGSVNSTYMITDHKFGPLGEKIRSGQDNMLRLLKLLYDFWITTHGDETLFVDLVRNIFVTASSKDEYGHGPPGGGRYTRFIPEDTIYFHLLATIHLNIESLVKTYSQLKDGLQFLTILLMRAMEENGITGKYLMLEKEYKSLFGVNDKKFDLGVDKENADKLLNIPPFISLSNTSLHDKITISNTSLHDKNTMRTGSVMKSLRENSARHHPYSRTGQGRTGQGRTGQGRTVQGLTGRGGGRRTRKYRRKTRTKKNLRKCKTHKKRKTRRGRK